MKCLAREWKRLNDSMRCLHGKAKAERVRRCQTARSVLSFTRRRGASAAGRASGLRVSTRCANASPRRLDGRGAHGMANMAITARIWRIDGGECDKNARGTPAERLISRGFSAPYAPPCFTHTWVACEVECGISATLPETPPRK